MKQYPILILAYRRTKELLMVLKSVEQLNPSRIYFHIHDAPDLEQQKEVDKVKKIITDYSGPKDISYSRKPLGVQESMRSAIGWIASQESQFYVFEDDIVLRPESSTVLNKAMKRLEEKGGILKFGENRGKGVYWGWAARSVAVLGIINQNILNIDPELIIPRCESKIHYRGLMELYKKEHSKAQSWDDEFALLTKVLDINEILTEEQLTDHIGTTSTRTSNGIDKIFGSGTHVMFKNGILISE